MNDTPDETPQTPATGAPDAEEVQECIIQNGDEVAEKPKRRLLGRGPKAATDAASAPANAEAAEAEVQDSGDEPEKKKNDKQIEQKPKKRGLGSRTKGFMEGLFHGHPETDWEQRYEEYQKSPAYQHALNGARSQKQEREVSTGQDAAQSAKSNGKGSAKGKGKDSAKGKSKGTAQTSGPGASKPPRPAYQYSSGNSGQGYGNAYGTTGNQNSRPSYFQPVKTRPLPLPGYGPVVGLVSPSKVHIKDFVEAIERAGGTALRIPLVADRRRLQVLYQACDALLFPGGRDVDPRRYGQSEEPHCKTQNPDVPRDGSELQLLEWAIEDGMPFLGICRGLQVINVGLEGTLWQDLKEQKVTNKPHKGATWPAHDANIVPDSTLGRIVGVNCVRVNSLHHQAVKELGRGLVVSAKAPDGVIEGIELQGHPFGIAVQFHPELLADYKQWAHDIFDRLILEAGHYRDSAAPRITRTFPAEEIQMWRAATPDDPPSVPRAGIDRAAGKAGTKDKAGTQAPGHEEKAPVGAENSSQENADNATSAMERAAMRGDLPTPPGGGHAQIVRDDSNRPQIVGRRRAQAEPAVEQDDGIGR